MRRIEKIITCPKCAGVGIIEVTYYKSPREPDIDTCPICKGEGRLLRKITIDDQPLKGVLKPIKTIYK